LFRLFPQRQIAIVPAVYDELRIGIRKGYVQLEDVMAMVEKIEYQTDNLDRGRNLSKTNSSSVI